MKKLFAFFLFAGMISFLACGPSAEEKAAAEKAKQDSINAVIEKAKQDSIALVEQAKLDSIAEAARLDSIAKAEEKAAMEAKKSVRKAPAKPVEDKTKVKAGQGKG